MKKLFSTFVVLMFLLSGLATAFAQDNTTTDVNTSTEVTGDTGANATVEAETTAEVEDNETPSVETEQPEAVEAQTEDAAEVTAAEEENETATEVATMNDAPGVEVRVTQLEARLDRAIAHGQDIIASVKGNNTAALQASLDVLVSLKAEVAALDTTGPVSESTARFVSIKKRAIEAVKAFRDAARKLIKEDKRAALKARLKAKYEARLAKFKTRIEAAKHKHNAALAASILERLGTSNPDLVAKLQSGEITVKEAISVIRAAYANLSKEKKAEARAKISEKVAEARVKKLAAVEQIRNKTRGTDNE